MAVQDHALVAMDSCDPATVHKPATPVDRRCVAWTEDYHRCPRIRSGRLFCDEHRNRRWWFPRLTFLVLALPSCWWFVELFFDKSRLQAENLALTKKLTDGIAAQNAQSADDNRELREHRVAQDKIETLRGVLSRIDNIQIPRISASQVFEAWDNGSVREPMVSLYVEGCKQHIAKLKATLVEAQTTWTDSPSRRPSEEAAKRAIRDAEAFLAFFEATAQPNGSAGISNPPDGLEPIAVQPSRMQPPKQLQHLAEAEARVARAGKLVQAHMEQGILRLIPRTPSVAPK